MYKIVITIAANEVAELNLKISEVVGVISKNGGKIDGEWALPAEISDLAYRIKGVYRGGIVHALINLPADKVEDTQKRLNLLAGVLRVMITKE